MKKIVVILFFTLLIGTSIAPIITADIDNHKRINLDMNMEIFSKKDRNPSKNYISSWDTVEWIKYFDYGASDWSQSVMQTNDNGYIISGGSGDKGIIIKTDLNGNEEWHNYFGWLVTKVKQTSDGGYILTSILDDYLENSAIIKIDENGKKLWEKSFGEIQYGDDWIECVCETQNGDYVSVGLTEKIDPVGDICVLKLDKDGNVIFDKVYGSYGEHQVAFYCDNTNDGGIILVGRAKEISGESYDVILMKLDTNGNVEWEKYIGGEGNEGGKCVQQTSDGGYILCGESNSWGAGLHDWYIVKTDSTGNEESSWVFGDEVEDFAESVYEASDGYYTITGNYHEKWADIYSRDITVLRIKKTNGYTDWNYWNIHETTDEHGAEGWETCDKGIIVAGSVYPPTNIGDICLIKFEGDNNPPDIPSKPSGPTTLKVGQTGTYTTSGTDPDGSMVQYIFEWDQNVYSQWTPLVTSGMPGSSDYSWSSPGAYWVKAKTRDECGLESSWSEALKVQVLPNNKPDKPDIDGPEKGNAGEEKGYTLTSVDPDGDQIAFWVNWGDDVEIDTVFIDSGSSIEVTHTWEEQGVYTITVIAYDEYGYASEPTTLEVSMPKNKIIYRFPMIHRFLEQHPCLFPILLRQILKI